MFGWSRSPVTTASEMNLSLRLGAIFVPGLSILIATVRAIDDCGAAYTTPMPPSPIISSSS